MNAPQVSSLRGLARRLGVADNAVRKAIKSGRLRASVGRDEKGRPCITDVELAATEWTQNVSRLPAPRETTKPTQPAEIISKDTLTEAQRMATLERGRKLRLENDLKDGRLVEVGKAAREAFEAARIIREAILNIPARLSSELAAESDGSRVYSKLDAALREALNSTSDRLLAVGE